jgi:hypothetical protein
MIAFWIAEHSHVLHELPCVHGFEICLNREPSSFFSFHFAKLKIVVVAESQQSSIHFLSLKLDKF